MANFTISGSASFWSFIPQPDAFNRGRETSSVLPFRTALVRVVFLAKSEADRGAGQIERVAQ